MDQILNEAPWPHYVLHSGTFTKRLRLSNRPSALCQAHVHNRGPTALPKQLTSADQLTADLMKYVAMTSPSALIRHVSCRACAHLLNVSAKQPKLLQIWLQASVSRVDVAVKQVPQLLAADALRLLGCFHAQQVKQPLRRVLLPAL